jgi:hypothetical protein
MLDRGGPCAAADLVEHRRPVIAFGGYPYLDQFMGRQGALDFGQHRARQPLVADEHYRVQGMGSRLEGAPLLGG